MFGFIARMRSRPAAYRRRVAFWISVGITFVIIVIWVVSLAVRFGGENTAPEPTAPGPFETFIRQAGDSFSSMRDLF